MSMLLVEGLFWTASFLLMWVYIGYPLFLRALGALEPAAPILPDAFEPTVSLIIAAHNEEAVIADKLENSLELQYQKEKLEIIVFSDASSDCTDEIVTRFASKGVKLLRIEGRKGKTYCQNRAVEFTQGDIVVFSDANSFYEPEALRRLLRGFGDKRVGCVSGELKYLESGERVEGEAAYWRYEQFVKKLESNVSSVVGANGSIYAVRREAYIPLRPDAISDFVEPLMLAREGYRVLHEPTAVAWEETGRDTRLEFNRRVRIVSRAVHCLLRYPGLSELLNPLHHGLFALQLWSHRALRWLTGVFLGASLGLNVALLNLRVLYAVLLVLQLTFYSLALFGFSHERLTCRRPPRLAQVPYHFCVSCIAMLFGVVRGVLRKAPVVWDTARQADS